MGWYFARVRWEASAPPKSLPRPSKTLADTEEERAWEEREAKVGFGGGGENDSGEDDFLLLFAFETAPGAPMPLFAPGSARVATSPVRRSEAAGAAGLPPARGAAFEGGATAATMRVALWLVADVVEGCIAFFLSLSFPVLFLLTDSGS